MPRNFNLTLPPMSAASLKEPKVLVRAGLGVLLVANLIAAVFAFHLAGASPEGINNELTAARLRLVAAQNRLNRSKMLAGRIDKGREEGSAFIANYLTTRRHTYSTIINEITETAKTAGMNMKEATIAPLDAIEGSDDLDMMTISVNFEGGYAQLIKFVNLLDRSPRFLIIESLQAAPQPKGDILTVNIKLNTFIREDAAEQAASTSRSGM
jgi:type IV pilus assembly protein PilO